LNTSINDLEKMHFISDYGIVLPKISLYVHRFQWVGFLLLEGCKTGFNTLKEGGGKSFL